MIVVDPSPLAYLALLAWPGITLLLFAWLPPGPAAVCAIFGAELLLPELVSFDFRGIPPLDRTSIPCLSAALACLLLHGRRLRGVVPGTGVECFVALLAAGALVTALRNRDPVAVAGLGIQGMSLYDGVSFATGIALTVWIPFYLGRALFRRPDDLLALFALLAAAILAYSPLVLFELRMSPQLHRLAYGFHQHEFIQTLRGGGFRPMVFTTHGLTLALFVFLAAAATTALWRARRRIFGLPSAAGALYLSLLLLTLKSLGAVLYAALVLPSIALLRPTWQLRIAALVSLGVLAYPLLRGADLFPTQAVLAAAAEVSQDRRASLAFRFENEDLLLAHARERIAFGWGTFGRHRVRDPVTGLDTSVTDGYWIIALGSQGAFGLVATLGLLLGPVAMANVAFRRWRSRRERLLVAALASCVAICGVNLLPNADFSPFVLLLAGALAGVSERPRAPSGRRRAAPADRGAE